MNNSVIQVAGLTKVFRDFWRRARVRAVHDLDLEIHPGEIYGLLGPNGSGKSTTIKVLLGLLYPTRGKVLVFGKPTHDVAIKSRIGYLPEESYLYRFLNARETLDYYGQLFQIPRRERRRRTEELLEMVGLKSVARRPVGEYSKGMARRIGLAQALINNPELLILDEPTSGLDPIGSKLVKDIIVRLGTVHRKTIVLSSHLLADVEEVCGRVTILYGGRVQVQGQMEDVLTRQDQIQFTTEALSDETVAEIEKLVLQREGKSLRLSKPRDRLENLFLRVVREAHEQKVETAGSAQTGEFATYLDSGDSEGRAVIESLVRADKPSSGNVDAPSAQTAAKPDESVLTELTQSADSDAPAEDQHKPKPSQVDRSFLDDLAGSSDDKDRP